MWIGIGGISADQHTTGGSGGQRLPATSASGALGDQRAEPGLRRLLARFALDRDRLRGTHEVARVRGDLLRLPAELVRAVEDGAAARTGVDDEAGHTLALLERVEDVGDVLGVLISGVGAVVHGVSTGSSTPCCGRQRRGGSRRWRATAPTNPR